jgi:Flp pilus assembly protein TadG
MRTTQHRRRGNATLEFTLVGIPVIFALISIVEMARGMWIYQTMAYAVKEGTRFTIVHGANCDPKINTSNNCQVTVGQIAQVIEKAGIGLNPAALQMEMKSLSDDTGVVTLSSLLNSSATFPTNPGNLQGSPITFSAQYPFQSAIAMFWPGASPGMQFGTYVLPASSEEKVQY